MKILKKSLIEQLYDEKRSVQEGMTAWENEERSNIYKYFKMHYENAKRFEEYGNRMRKYDEDTRKWQQQGYTETQQQKAREQIQKIYYEMQTQKNVIKYQEQQARDDLTEMNNEIKSRHISEWGKRNYSFFLQ